ncbi:hypothetical protein P4O66_019037, partial [Electrophorus voltai]
YGLFIDTWFEITPDECGYSLTGAFVDSKCLGSQFVKGAKTEEHPEIDMLYLQGLCGSALADGDKIRNTSLYEHIKICMLKHFSLGKLDKEGNEIKVHAKLSKESLKKHTLSVCHSFFDWFPELKVDEVHPSILKSKTRQYEDAGLLVNSPYFSVLRKERNVDLIISLDFSDGDPFETVDKAAQMCKDLQIPFPTVEHPENIEEPEDFYVFKNNPNAPVVIHIPFFNAGNCKGEVNMWKNRYQTFQSAYNDKMISDLLEKAGLNITNTKEKLLREIEEVIKKKKEHS